MPINSQSDMQVSSSYHIILRMQLNALPHRSEITLACLSQEHFNFIFLEITALSRSSRPLIVITIKSSWKSGRAIIKALIIFEGILILLDYIVLISLFILEVLSSLSYACTEYT